ncbi:hypothetical protein HUU42_01160 [bacterium]|nr:hypothetical protein [bacterium]
MNNEKRSGLFKIILLTGLLAGTLDIFAAFINAYISSGTSPAVVMQFIASGVFGRDAFAGEWMMVAWGTLFHYGIVMSWTTLFFMLYPKMSFLSKSLSANAIGYGIFVWIMMNQVVLPLSNVPRLKGDPIKMAIAIFILIVAIGWPISWMARRYYSRL